MEWNGMEWTLDIALQLHVQKLHHVCTEALTTSVENEVVLNITTSCTYLVLPCNL